MILKPLGGKKKNPDLKLTIIEEVLAIWQSKKHQESLSLLRQLQRQPLSDVTILELCSLLRALNFQGKVWTVNCG